MNRIPVIGLTGGIGSGKSAAADAFARHGAAIVDTDVIAHQLTAPHGTAIPAISAAFGPGILRPDGALDRDAMRQRIFANAGEREKLENILHPLIRQQSDRLVQSAMAQGAPYIVLVVPLLVESGNYRDRVDRIVVVDCSEDTQIARVMARNQRSESEVRTILAAQASRDQRLAVADDILDNDHDLLNLHHQIGMLDANFKKI